MSSVCFGRVEEALKVGVCQGSAHLPFPWISATASINIWNWNSYTDLKKKKLSLCQLSSPLKRMGLLFHFSWNMLLQPAPEDPKASVDWLISLARFRKSRVFLLEVQRSAPYPLPFPRTFPILLTLCTAHFWKCIREKLRRRCPSDGTGGYGTKRGEELFLVLSHGVHDELEEKESPRGRAAPSHLN